MTHTHTRQIGRFVQRLGLLLFAATLFAPVCRADLVYAFNPAATYLRTNLDPAPDATPFLLSDGGFAPGDTISLHGLGDFSFLSGNPDENIRPFLAVFSTSATLDVTSILNRVVDAIEAGDDHVTGNTFVSGLPTDIPEDFLIQHSELGPATQITIPVGATHLFFSIADSRYFDNGDADNDMAVSISGTTVPEPSAFAFFVLVAGVTGATSKRRRRRASEYSE